MSTPKRIAVTLEVTNDAEAQELKDAWQEIVTGKRLVRAEALEHSLEAVMERARVALQVIEAAIHQAGGQAATLVRFLAALYNGHDYAFDLTELRGLDTAHCRAVCCWPIPRSRARRSISN
jgi:hypothetical protein